MYVLNKGRLQIVILYYRIISPFRFDSTLLFVVLETPNRVFLSQIKLRVNEVSGDT